MDEGSGERDQGKNRGLLGRLAFWDRPKKSLVSPVEESVISESIPTFESAKNPEELKEEIEKKLIQLAHTQLTEIQAKEKLDNLHNWYEREARNENGGYTMTQQEYAQKLKEESKGEKRKEQAKELVNDIEKAQGIVGDFCVIVGEGERKGVIFLKPLQKEVKLRGFRNEAFAFEGAKPQEDKFLYEVTKKTDEVFFVGVEGVGKAIFEQMIEYKVAEDMYQKEAWLKSHINNIQSSFERYKLSAGEALGNLLNGFSSQNNHETRQITEQLKAAITGFFYVGIDDRSVKTDIKAGTELNHGVPIIVVTRGEDLKEVFDGSIKGAENKKQKALEAPTSWEATRFYLYKN